MCVCVYVRMCVSVCVCVCVFRWQADGGMLASFDGFGAGCANDGAGKMLLRYLKQTYLKHT